ncbi:MAG: nucleoside triphosphate pyrophosphohydrolase [Candidatus Binataceae bacterium]
MSDDLKTADAIGFSRLLEIVRELRVRCPWDREQTLQGLSKHLIEEAYEAANEIERDDSPALADELGDLLAQTLFASVIAEETRRFRVIEMIAGAADKLVRRHPHVYGDAKAESVGEVLENWSRIKQEERRRAGKTSALDGVARALPALMRAEKLGARARQAGMDWPDIGAVLAKVREELEEAEAALARGDRDAVVEELGDMMLALANAPRFVDQSAEETLRRACDKFIARFAAVERLIAARGLDLKRLAPAEIESLWQEAKRLAP